MKRSGKFYRKNEAEVMKSLGLKPTKNSGSGWIEKSDGQSESVICELKSTDAASYRLKLEDLHTLDYNASVCRKIPVFAVQFLGTQEVFLLVKPELLGDLAKYLDTGEYDSKSVGEFVGVDLSNHKDTPVKRTNVIKSSCGAKDKFKSEIESKFKKEKRSAL